MLEDLLQFFLQQYGFDRTYWVAYSGGLDSHVLLHLLVHLRKNHPFSLRAIHVHHGISPHADEWLQHCQDICRAYEVELLCEKVIAKPVAGESLEEHARQKRYAKLSAVLTTDDILLTGHHQDDQAETFLLQLLRGAGPKGLSAMPEIKTLGEGTLARPLLGVAREELRTYAEKHGLSWIEDELNLDLDYPRNFLRYQVLPLLKSHWPAATVTIARSAKHCAEAQKLLEDFGRLQLTQVLGSKPRTLLVKQLLELSSPHQRLVIRNWLESQQVSLPNAAKLYEIQTAVLKAKPDSMPCVSWGGVEVRRYQDDIYVMPTSKPYKSKQVWRWSGQNDLIIPELGKLEANQALGSGLKAGLDMEVRFRQGGEVYSLASGRHHELKKLFQEKNIPTWERDRVPLIHMAGELAMVPGILLVDKFKAKELEAGLEIRWIPSGGF
jgi:tRNA(Ile)-lysidine synthase